MKVIITLIFISSFSLFAQSAEIVEKLKMIEAGKVDEVMDWYNNIDVAKYEDESIKIIDALLTMDADKAVKKYDDFQKKYPKSNLASLALFRIYSYYFSLGQYSKAKEYSDYLRKRFPNSVYVKNINESNLKDENFEAEKAPEPIEIDTEKSEPAIQSQLYFIQVGAFSNITNARQLQKRLIAKKHKANLTKKNINGIDLNVVSVGNYKSLDEAEKALKKINEEFKVNGKIFLVTK